MSLPRFDGGDLLWYGQRQVSRVDMMVLGKHGWEGFRIEEPIFHYFQDDLKVHGGTIQWLPKDIWTHKNGMLSHGR